MRWGPVGVDVAPPVVVLLPAGGLDALGSLATEGAFSSPTTELAALTLSSSPVPSAPAFGGDDTSFFTSARVFGSLGSWPS